MKQPWYRIVLFACLLFFPMMAGEIYVRLLPNPSKSKHAYLKKNSANVDILILGSSHTYYGICPEILSSHAYSAAQVSQTLRYDDYLLHHYPFTNLHTVILPISDFSLYEELETGPEWYLANRYRLYMDCDLHSRLSVYDWEITAFPVFCEKLKSLWQSPQMSWSSYGQGLEYSLGKRKDNWDNGKDRAATNHYTDFSGAPQNEKHLNHIAEFCKTHHTLLVLISTPLRPGYRAHQDQRQITDTQERIKRFMNRYPNTLYLDYRDNPHFTKNDFYDADHLSYNGAQKLSHKLKNDLSRLHAR